jgi:hypothetical protein
MLQTYSSKHYPFIPVQFASFEDCVLDMRSEFMPDDAKVLRHLRDPLAHNLFTDELMREHENSLTELVRACCVGSSLFLCALDLTDNYP